MTCKETLPGGEAMFTIKKEKIIYSKLPEDSHKYTEKMNKYYDILVVFYDVWMFLFPLWKKWISSVIPYIQGQRVLEVSFGSGYLMKKYAKNHEVCGIDYNQKMVKKTRKRLKGMVSSDKIIQGNVEHLPYDDNYFDTVINTMAFTGYPDGEKALNEMLRVLKSGGSFLLVDIDYPSDRNIFGYSLVKMTEWSGDIIKDIKNLLEQKKLQYICENIGGFGSIKLYVITK
jgi:ubiquinone/menaquinone biosynthesis C-methylase UbiE